MYPYEQRSKEETSGSTRANMMKIHHYIEEHYDQALTVESLAQMAGVSPKYFVDLFKKTFGYSALKYLTALRMNRAKRYLTESNYRIREIAQLVGYSDEFYFSRKFKKEVGIPPSAFIQHSKKRIAVCSPALMGQLLALDTIPIAAPLDPKWTPYYYQVHGAHIETHFVYRERHWEEDDMSKIGPDAVIATDMLSDKIKQKLSRIAPILFVSSQVTWKEQLRQIAAFIQKEEKAEAWIERFEQKLLVARKKVSHALGDEQLAILRVYGNDLYLYCNQGMQEILYQQLGLKCVYPCEAPHNLPLTLDELKRLDPDRLLVLVCNESASRTFWLMLQHASQWQKLKAVSKGCVNVIPSDPWCEYSASAVDRMLDELLLLYTGYCPSQLTEKLHGRTNPSVL
ncbi:AraC family transcriptional regulator [Marinicrinis lubricantis]|uniref:AraC family transcriptional regulator n=1 Tax=Marinicrinis lubricantis TaxID=2086470 RepID=A0ABW1IUN1_9BACL